MYAKLFKSMYDGTLRGKPYEILVFTNLLANADADGHADIHPRVIADATGLSLDNVMEALKTLESEDPDSRSPEMGGRRIVRLNDHRSWGWSIVNIAKYRAIKSDADRREQNRASQARFRSKKSEVSNDKQ